MDVKKREEMNFFQYQLKTFYDGKEIINSGLVVGRTYKHAMENLVEYVGDDNEIISCSLRLLGEFGNILTYQDNAFDISNFIL